MFSFATPVSRSFSPRLSKDDCHKIWMINFWCDVWMSSAALSLTLYMIEWMALLDLTGDWYRKRMSIVDSNPSMSLYLRFMLEQQQVRSTSWREFKANIAQNPLQAFWTAVRAPRHLVQFCNSSDLTFWLIRHYFISPRDDFLDSRKFIDERKSNKERRTRSLKSFSEQIETSKMIYFSFRFVFCHDFRFGCDERVRKGWFDVETL